MARIRYGRLDDGELLRRTAAGDPQAFGVFYDRLETDVLTYFLRATRRADLAADLTAETFAAGLASACRYRPELGTGRAWLFGIARHELADVWERGRVEDLARRRLQLETLTLGDAALAGIERLSSAPESAAEELLAALPEEQRRAVAGRVLLDRDYAELAAALECSPSVVRQRVSRGLRTLRSRLEHTG